MTTIRIRKLGTLYGPITTVTDTITGTQIVFTRESFEKIQNNIRPGQFTTDGTSVTITGTEGKSSFITFRQSDREIRFTVTEFKRALDDDPYLQSVRKLNQLATYGKYIPFKKRKKSRKKA